MHRSLMRIALISTALFLTACSGWFDKDNTPTPAALKPIQTRVVPKLLWSKSIGTLGDPSIRQNPVLANGTLYVSNQRGDLMAIDATNGHVRFQQSIHQPTVSGPAASDQVVVLASRQGHVVAFDAKNGTKLWQQSLHTEVLAAPAIQHDVVVIKSASGELRAFHARSGESRWTFRQVEPTLLLHSASTPTFSGNDLYAGFANGNLVRLNGQTGQAHWLETITEPQGAFSIERMIDIDADPIFHDHRVLAASYQGKIVAIDKHSGRMQWWFRLSSYTGMIANHQSVFITDAKGSLFAFDIANGQRRFEQSELHARVLNAPVLIGAYGMVGDQEGYLHFFDQSTGQIVGRVALSGAIVATPATNAHHTYVLTQSGQLYAYSLSS